MLTRILFTVLLLLILLLFISACGGGNINGVVKDGITGEPIPDALVIITSRYMFLGNLLFEPGKGFHSLHTDTNGEYQLKLPSMMLFTQDIDWIIATKENYRSDGIYEPKEKQLIILLYPTEQAAGYPLTAPFGIIESAQDLYYLKQAEETGNENLCKQTSLRARGICYQSVALASEDPSVCNLITGRDQRAFCVMSIAFKTQNPGLCETFKDIQDDCYLKYAESEEDPELCKNIISPTTRDGCLRWIS